MNSAKREELKNNTEKVMAGLKCCSSGVSCINCTYYPFDPQKCNKLLKDAHDLLASYMDLTKKMFG